MLILSMIPLYLIGNFHCMGMCGPLVAFLGRHPNRRAYFLGRIVAFTLAGLIAGEVGAVINHLAHLSHLSSIVTLSMALLFFCVSLTFLFNITLPKVGWVNERLRIISLSLSKLMLRERFFPIFLFGLATILLPCGQSLMVFSFSALTQDAMLGALNALLFATLTTPSLWVAMHATQFFKQANRYYRPLMGICLMLISTLTLLRGLADLEIVPHLVINEQTHFIIY